MAFLPLIPPCQAYPNKGSVIWWVYLTNILKIEIQKKTGVGIISSKKPEKPEPFL